MANSPASTGDLPETALAKYLRAAAAAPSLHNSQPWRFRLRNRGVDVLADRGRQLWVLDPDGRELAISVGAAVMNLRVAVRAGGRTPLLWLGPAGGRRPAEPDPLARVVPGPRAPASETARLLERAIWRRHTNRRPFYDLAVPPEVLAELVAAARCEHAELTLLEPDLCDAVLGIAAIAHARQGSDPAYVAELGRWTRAVPGREDGVPPAAFGPVPMPDSLPLRDFGLAHSARRRAVARFEPEPTIAMLHTAGDGVRDWLHAGQALERVLLTATVHGVATSVMTQPLEEPDLRLLLAEPAAGRSVQGIVRLGYGPPSPPSPRRPLADLMLPVGNTGR